MLLERFRALTEISRCDPPLRPSLLGFRRRARRGTVSNCGEFQDHWRRYTQGVQHRYEDSLAILVSKSDIPITEQCERLAYEMTNFMYGIELEQRIRLSPNIPSVEEYWSCRIISSGVGVCVAVNE